MAAGGRGDRCRGADAPRLRGALKFPDRLEVAGRSLPVFVNELRELGRYLSVNLVSDVSLLTSPAQARTVASAVGAPFRQAIGRALQEADVADPQRRRLLRGR